MKEKERREMEERIGDEAYEEHKKQVEFDKTPEGLNIINEKLRREIRVMGNEFSRLEKFCLKESRENLELKSIARKLESKCWELFEDSEYVHNAGIEEEIESRQTLEEEIGRIKEDARI